MPVFTLYVRTFKIIFCKIKYLFVDTYKAFSLTKTDDGIKKNI